MGILIDNAEFYVDETFVEVFDLFESGHRKIYNSPLFAEAPCRPPVVDTDYDLFIVAGIRDLYQCVEWYVPDSAGKFIMIEYFHIRGRRAYPRREFRIP